MKSNRGIRAAAAAAFILALGAGFAAADEKPAPGNMPKMDPGAVAAMMAEMMKNATPGPEHKIFESSIGKWKAVTKSFMVPGKTDVTEGTAESEWVLGGRFLMTHYHGTMMGMPFEGLEVLGYDRKAGHYAGYWLDTTSTAFYAMPNGTWDEASKTLTFMVDWPNPAGEGTATYKMATKMTGADSKVFTMSMMNEGQEVPMMEATYTRMK
jgi:hypothetical protein